MKFLPDYRMRNYPPYPISEIIICYLEAIDEIFRKFKRLCIIDKG